MTLKCQDNSALQRNYINTELDSSSVTLYIVASTTLDMILLVRFCTFWAPKNYKYLYLGIPTKFCTLMHTVTVSVLKIAETIKRYNIKITPSIIKCYS